MWSYDYVRIFDGNISRVSDLLTEVSGFYYSYTNVFPSNISSSSNKLLVKFISDERFRTNGFKLKIHTEPLFNSTIPAEACSLTNPCKDKEGHCQSDDECKGDLKCGNHNDCSAELGYHQQFRCCYDYCSQWLDMENGILTSPQYPSEYPVKLRCHTLLTVGMTVAGPRTITLEFLHFKVSI